MVCEAGDAGIIHHFFPNEDTNLNIPISSRVSCLEPREGAQALQQPAPPSQLQHLGVQSL